MTVDQGVYRWRFNNRDFRNVFAFTLTTSRDMAKRTPPFDSTHQIGVSTFSREVLTVDQGVCRWRFKIVKSGTFLLPLWEPIEALHIK